MYNSSTDKTHINTLDSCVFGGTFAPSLSLSFNFKSVHLMFEPSALSRVSVNSVSVSGTCCHFIFSPLFFFFFSLSLSPSLLVSYLPLGAGFWSHVASCFPFLCPLFLTNWETKQPKSYFKKSFKTGIQKRLKTNHWFQRISFSNEKCFFLDRVWSRNMTLEI